MASKSFDKTKVEHGDDIHDVDVVVQLAHDVENQDLSPWTPRMFRLYLVLGCAYLCGCLNGMSIRDITIRNPSSQDLAS
ncbi:hypothetical protein NW754_002853 [Fusarium falciforme]|uniref:Uncharacterized protein n=1 Tax=Fusarium falciforme TaxID=195108 RepID=A0A9W8UW26_9HYPO|nr:hypothetical protein NW754_002853 [Fusarium falciforme]KAJ4181491.1 hypothetical protein NW755_011028 [Fusarium falciforme]KAJ4193852.1 hypothetical protein NW767_010091 [Fusarium falciforme]